MVSEETNPHLPYGYLREKASDALPSGCCLTSVVFVYEDLASYEEGNVLKKKSRKVEQVENDW
jgi:hypothetical protein